MNNSDISIILKKIRNYKYDNLKTPTKVIDFNELNEYWSFENIKDLIKNNQLEIIIPIPNIYWIIFDLSTTKKQHFINSLYYNWPYVIALIWTVFWLVSENYILLLLLLIVFLSTLLASLLPLLWIIIYLFIFWWMFISFINENINLLIIFTTILITIISVSYLKINRKNILIQNSLENEEIFSFLFFSRTLQILDIIKWKMIYSK